MKKMKPSLRTAGAVSGKRPMTAPINVREKWKTEKVCLILHMTNQHNDIVPMI